MIRRTTNLAVNKPVDDLDTSGPELPAAPTEQTPAPSQPNLGDDLLRGADEIAEFVFGDARHRRRIYYLTGVATRGLPYFKLGNVICARRSTLMRWIEEQEARR